MKRIQDREGYLLIDNRNGPGVPAEILRASGLPPEAGRGVYEGATYTCGHCQRQVIINSLRTREREFCRKCHSVICDPCAAHKARTLECRPFEQWAQEHLTAQGV